MEFNTFQPFKQFKSFKALEGGTIRKGFTAEARRTPRRKICLETFRTL
jgi:hypothetical protein